MTAPLAGTVAAPGAERPGEGGGLIARLRGPAFVLVAALVLAVHVLLGADELPVLARFLAGGMGVFTLWQVIHETRARIPFITYGVVQIYVFFGLATFWSREFLTLAGPVFLRDESINAAVAAAFASMVALVVFGHIGERFALHLRARIPSILSDDALAAPSADAVGVGALAVLTVMLTAQLILQERLPVALSQVVFLFSRPPLAQALIFSVHRATRSRLSYVAFFVYTAVAVFLGLLSGMLVDIMTPLVSAVLLLWLDGRRFRARWLLGIVVVFLVLNPVKHEFRKEKSSRSMLGESVGLSEVAALWTDALVVTWTGESASGDAVEENFESSANRLSALLAVANVIQAVPDEVPYSGGTRWWLVVGSYIPRALDPSRPDLRLATSGDYALTFLLQTEAQLENSTVALPLIADGFWAFGWLGVAIGIVAVGLLYGLYQGLLLPTSWVSVVIGVSTWSYLISYDHFVRQFTGVPQRIFISWLVCAGVALAVRMLDRRRERGRGRVLRVVS